MRLARAVRVLCGGFAALLTLFAIFLVWRACEDFQMQVRHVWIYLCSTSLSPPFLSRASVPVSRPSACSDTERAPHGSADCMERIRSTAAANRWPSHKFIFWYERL